MPTKSQLRKRRNSPSGASSNPANDQEQPESKTLPERIVPYLPVLKIVGSLTAGIWTAASFSSWGAAVSLFIATFWLSVGVLIRVTMSIIHENDQTPVYMPDVHNPDGTVRPQQQMTVFQHDDKVAKYFSREFPALSLGVLWFYIWTRMLPIFALLSVFIAYRIFFHPLFRIHIWREEPSKELGRPFGAAPLFDKEASRVKTVESDAQFQTAIQDAKKGSVVVVDCSATWCGPCKQMAPIFEQIADEFPGQTFVSVDVDIARDVATNLAVTSVPSFVIFKDKQRMEMIKGASPDKLRESIQSYL